MIDSPAIVTRDLAKRYGAIQALAGLSMTIPRASVFGFLGPNGAGKTTAVKLLLGLSRPTSGEGEILGQPIGERRSRRRVGYLPELFRYQPWLTAREVLLLHCELTQIDRAAWSREIEDALAIVGLTDRAATRVGTFSKGMQQRLGLGVALLGDPELVLLDEPTSALDPVGRHDVREIIRTLRDRGMTVFLNSHLLSEVLPTASPSSTTARSSPRARSTSSCVPTRSGCASPICRAMVARVCRVSARSPTKASGSCRAASIRSASRTSLRRSCGPADGCTPSSRRTSRSRIGS